MFPPETGKQSRIIMLNIQRFVCNPFQENCYIVSDDTNEAVIIDCGAYFKEERTALVNYIQEKKLTPKHLLATHGHIDHNFGNDTIWEQYGLKPELCTQDERLYQGLKEQALRLCGISIEYDFPPVGRFLADKDIIEFGNHRLSVIHTPGHSPGSVFLYCQEEKLAFSGDTLFKMSIGRTDFDFGSFDDIMDSLGMIRNTLPADTIVLPGHGPQTTLAEEIRSNPFMK